MAWDKTKPAGATTLKNANPEILENQDCLEDAIARNHTFPGTKLTTAGEHKMLEIVDNSGDESAEVDYIKFWNNAGALNMIIPGGSVLAFQSVPPGEIVVFEKDTAVAGWTLKTDKDDMLLFITKGSAAGGETGGGDHSTGTWTQPSHTLTIPELPSHTHTYTYSAPNTFYYDPVAWVSNHVFSVSTQNTGSKGGGGSHNHGSTWRPKARNFTRQEKS